MTKAFRIFTCSVFLTLAACGENSGTNDEAENIVNVYNWADAVAPGVIEQFEEETGIKVNYDTYSGSAIVDVKLLTGNSGYDVIFHDRMLAARLIDIGVFQKLRLDQLPNFANLDPEIMELLDIYESVRGYAAPFHWGTTGFSWNVDMVRERLPDQPMDTAAVLFDPEVISKLADCGVSFLDSPTALLPIALAYLGLDPNTADEESLAAIQEMLLEVRPYVRYFSNEKYLTDMPNKELCVGMAWSGDYANSLMRAEEAGIDIDLAYTVPKEGGPLWIDGIFIPSDAPHVDNAHVFINFLMRGDIAFENANYSNYATPNAVAMAMFSEESRKNPAIFPDEEAWRRTFPYYPKTPIEDRALTRVLARVKSGL